MKYLYHYHASTTESNYAQAIELPKAIESCADYDEFHQLIADKIGVDKDKVLIRSITLLWATNDEQPE